MFFFIHLEVALKVEWTQALVPTAEVSVGLAPLSFLDIPPWSVFWISSVEAEW
jgi:hypothetical protein